MAKGGRIFRERGGKEERGGGCTVNHVFSTSVGTMHAEGRNPPRHMAENQSGDQCALFEPHYTHLPLTSVSLLKQENILRGIWRIFSVLAELKSLERRVCAVHGRARAAKPTSYIILYIGTIKVPKTVWASTLPLPLCTDQYKCIYELKGTVA